MLIWGSVIVKVFELVGFFVQKWAKDQKTKEEWARLTDQARSKYNSQGADDSAQIKRDYDELQDDLRNGRNKL